MAELKRFNLPDVGEGLIEADIIKWHVQPGDPVETNQTIVEIETAKAIVELPSPYEGVVAELLVGEGDTVDVGTPIFVVDVSGMGGSGASGAAAPPVPAHPAGQEPAKADPGAGRPARQPVLVGYGIKAASTQRRPRKSTAPATAAQAPPPAWQAAPEPEPVQPAQPAQPVAAGTRTLAKPPVRKMAKELGVDLSSLNGTGPQGTITREDVQAAAAPAPAAPRAPAAARRPAGREERIPVRGVRKSTATAMVKSAFSAPHVTEFLQIDMTESMETVRRLRTLPEFAEVKVSPLLLVCKAVLLAVHRHPMINSVLDGEEIVIRHYVNLGIATATHRGLIVPNIKDAHEMSLPELAGALNESAETVRAGRARPADLSGGTITITNVGVFGVDAGTPIITPGETAILAFGQVRDMPWVHQGELAIRKVTTLSLSFDHRVVDGELGSAVLRDVGAMLEDPVRMLAWS